MGPRVLGAVCMGNAWSLNPTRLLYPLYTILPGHSGLEKKETELSAGTLKPQMETPQEFSCL